ncbi:hypothetical protein ACIA5C_47740 [Actinoplanes sp. NPDC051343]|uniref:hypothetical protein n=1 Tax=Actinoplanes sp. NPDC051343 TaxID=3363906 RepID=UPI0037900B9A
MRRVVLDNDALYCLAHRGRNNDAEAVDVLRIAVEQHRLQLMATHILREEATAGVGDARKEQMASILEFAVNVPTGAFLFDISEFGQAAPGVDDATIKQLRDGITVASRKHAHDALITSTALAQNATLVSLDNRAIRRARELDVAVMSPLELLLEAGYEPTWLGAQSA